MSLLKKNDNKAIKKKKLYYYEKGKFDEFVKEFLENKYEVLPISCLIDQNGKLTLSKISNQKHLIVDITSIVIDVHVRNHLRLNYESYINFLNKNSGVKVDYCIEKLYFQEAYDMFTYFFEKNEDFIKELHEVKNTGNLDYKLNQFSIVNCSKKEYDDIFTALNNQLYGHQKFKEDFKDQLEAFILLHRMKIKKTFSLLICGKSGIGKTEVARILQRKMYPNESPIKINFGNYSGKGSLWSLIGSPKGYIGSEQGGELTNKIMNSRSKIIIIDELDKADEQIFTFFYEMLEDGQYTDLDGKVIDLDEYIIIFTANLNSDNFKKIIPEPLFSRFDMTYEFKALSQKDKMEFILDLINQLMDAYIQNIEVIDRNKIKNQIMDKAFYNCDNLRNIKRNVMNCFVNLVKLDSLWSEHEYIDN